MGKGGEEEGGSMKRSTQNRAQGHCYSSLWGGEKTRPLFPPSREGKARLPPQVSG